MILFQDNDILVADKPSGLLVHPYWKETNERDNLMMRLKQKTGLYLYPIHRIDRPVSGIVIFGLNQDVVRGFKDIWHTDEIRKEYVALVRGDLENAEGVFDFDLFDDNKNPQQAVTHYQQLEKFSDTTLVKVWIETGRRHQIRRHFSRRCHNIIGDSKYGRGDINRRFRDDFGLSHIFLHSHRMAFIHPVTNQHIEIVSPLPPELQRVLDLQQ